MQMLCEILDATETNVLHVSSAVHSIYVISFLLLQCQIQLVRRHVDEVSISPDRRLHLHEDFLRAPVICKGQLEVARAAALSFLVEPGDLAGAAVLFPVWEEGVDQLLSPLSDAGRVVFVFRQHQGLRHGAIQRQILQHILQSTALLQMALSRVMGGRCRPSAPWNWLNTISGAWAGFWLLEEVKSFQNDVEIWSDMRFIFLI